MPDQAPTDVDPGSTSVDEGSCAAQPVRSASASANRQRAEGSIRTRGARSAGVRGGREVVSSHALRQKANRRQNPTEGSRSIDIWLYYIRFVGRMRPGSVLPPTEHDAAPGHPSYSLSPVSLRATAQVLCPSGGPPLSFASGTRRDCSASVFFARWRPTPSARDALRPSPSGGQLVSRCRAEPTNRGIRQQPALRRRACGCAFRPRPLVFLTIYRRRRARPHAQPLNAIFSRAARYRSRLQRRCAERPMPFAASPAAAAIFAPSHSRRPPRLPAWSASQRSQPCSLGALGSGSPAGYYFQPSSSTPPSNSWVIYLQGVRAALDPKQGRCEEPRCPVRCTV